MQAEPITGTGIRSHLANWRKRRIVKLGKRLRRPFDAAIARYSMIPTTPIIAHRHLPWADELEQHWQTIRGEAEQLLHTRDHVPPLSEISRDHAKIAHGEDWRSLFLWAYGIRIDHNCTKCPETTRLVERIPDLQTAMFSILEPGTHIPPHKGVTQAIFNSHLGLIVPGDADDCWINIDGEYHGWSPGKLLAFDDTYRHEVRNDTSGDRVVLLLQVKRPVRFPGSLAADFFLEAVRRSPFIKDGLAGLNQWERQHGNASGSNP